MGDSPKYRPRSPYAQPGDLDTSLLDADFWRSRQAEEPKPNRPSAAPLDLDAVPEPKPASLRPSVQPPSFPKPPARTAPARPAESRPSLPRMNLPTDPFYKGLAPPGNVEPNRKNLAPAPGLIDGKPAAFSLGVDPSLNRNNPGLQRGLAPLPRFASTPSIPLRPVDISAPVFARKPAPSPLSRPRPELKSAIQNSEPPRLPTHSPVRSPLVRRSVPARFDLLPDAQPRWNQFGVSAVGQLVILGLALLSPMVFPQEMKTALRFDVIEVAQPVTEIPVAPEPPKPPAVQPLPKPKPKPKPKVAPKAPELKPEVPEAPLVPQLSPRQPHVFLNLKPVVPKAHVVEEKSLELKQNLKQPEIVLSSSGPKAPKEPPKPAGLSGPAPGTVNAALNKVQTGGFGNPNGVAGPGNANRRGNINQAGSPGLPGGPGYGNGTGGAQGLRGTLASDGSGKGGGRGAASAASASSGVAILYKPNPAYSAQGRERKIQGDVVLEVIFLASGQLKVTRVVSGLGFGLDDEAIQSAQRIRFTPATRDGKPVDFPARVRIEFRLVE